MKPLGQAIRDEFRRFERRRLRPLFRRFKPRPVAAVAAPLPARVEPEPPLPAAEELLIALARAELRRRSAAPQRVGCPAPVSLPVEPAGDTDAERLVRALLEPARAPETRRREAGDEAA